MSTVGCAIWLDGISVLVRRFISAVIISIFTGYRFYDTDWRNGNMATKWLKTVDSQRKITDFAFSKPESAQPNTTSRPQDISDQEVPEIVHNDGDLYPKLQINRERNATFSIHGSSSITGCNMTNVKTKCFAHFALKWEQRMHLHPELQNLLIFFLKTAVSDSSNSFQEGSFFELKNA